MASRKKSSKKKEFPRGLAELGQFLRAQRKAQRLSQSTLADLAGVGLNFISQVESGKGSAHIGKVLLLINTLGLQVRLEHGPNGIVLPSKNL